MGRTDAITSTQAALNLMSREIGNAGYGLGTNGIVLGDTNGKALRFRANLNNDGATDSPGEDVMYYYDSTSQSVLRYDKYADEGNGATSGIINQVSDVDFEYYNYNADGSFDPPGSVAAVNTGRVTIILKVILPNVQGQPVNRIETVRSDVTLRNSLYHLGQY